MGEPGSLLIDCCRTLNVECWTFDVRPRAAAVAVSERTQTFNVQFNVEPLNIERSEAEEELLTSTF